MMGKVKEAVIEGEVFACEHYNIPEMEFIYKARAEFGSESIQYEAAINEWYEIQRDFQLMFAEEETFH